LQQGKEVPVWGTAREGEVVTVEIENQKISTTAKNGKWLVRLKSLQVGGPYVMKISGDNTVTLRNLLVGEVWLCSGQSNMDRKLGVSAGGPPIPNREVEAAAAQYPQVRFFTVPKKENDTLQTEVSGKWQPCDPAAVLELSAVGYFFGSELHKSIKVPVGLIVSSWGGTPAEAWTPREVLEKNFPRIIERQKEAVANYAKKSSESPAEQSEVPAQSKNNPATAKAPGKGGARKASQDQNPAESPKRPFCLYNAMVNPLLPYAMRGVIWYQGEANNREAEEYQTLFPAMIASWRKVWNQGDFPFLFVQIAPFQAMSPEIREAQFLTWKTTPHTAMVVTTDVGDAKSIHPANKRPVGERLVLAARALAYGEKLEYSGPAYESMTVQGAQAVLTFSHCGSGLLAKGGELKGFVIAGADLQFVPAKAEIKGQTVVVSSAAVPSPKAVRYGWVNVPDVNLYNQEGLPASPFRTDVPQ
jgi:sialate O-acetylesterase